MPGDKPHPPNPDLKKRGPRRPEDEPKLIGQWRTGRTIGKGSSGRVKIAKHVRTGQYAAVKIVSKHALMNSRLSMHAAGEQADKILLAIEREIVIMKLVDHPNVLSLYDVWETSDELYIIMEYVEGGELFDYLVSRGRLSLPEALHYFQQIISAVDYCHRFNIAHRDLKPENLLLDRSRRNIKVADFGMAAWEGGTPGGGMLETSCGSPHYASPEIVQGKKYSGACSDIWSCGVILYALCTGRLPFDHPDIRTLLQMVKKGEYLMPPDLPSNCKHLISRMLEKDVSKRITMSEILQHPFFISRPPRPIAGVHSAPPTLEEVARPVSSAADIDADIFANLRTLWHGAPDADIVAGLLNGEKTWEKAVYHLLLQYRARHLENYNMEEDEVAPVPQPKRHRAAPAPPQQQSLEQVRQASPELETHTPIRTPPPPRPSAPTPKRAAGMDDDTDTPTRQPMSRGYSDTSSTTDERGRLIPPLPIPPSPATSTAAKSPRPLPTPVMTPQTPTAGPARTEFAGLNIPPPPSPRVEQAAHMDTPPRVELSFLAPPTQAPSPSLSLGPSVPAIALQGPTPTPTPQRTPEHARVAPPPPIAYMPNTPRTPGTPTPSLHPQQRPSTPSSLASPKLSISVPQTADPAVQQFFNDIVEHLNKIEQRHSQFAASPVPSSRGVFPPFTLSAPPPPTPASGNFSLDVASPVDPTQFEDAHDDPTSVPPTPYSELASPQLGAFAHVGLGISGNGTATGLPSPVLPSRHDPPRSSLLPPQLRAALMGGPHGRGEPGNRGSAPPARRPPPTPTRARARSFDSPSRRSGEDKENTTPARRTMEGTRSALDPRDLGMEPFVIVDRPDVHQHEAQTPQLRGQFRMRNVLAEKHVQIVLPQMPERSVKKKKSMIGKAQLVSPTSSEDFSANGSSTGSFPRPMPVQTPKRTWFSNLFNFKAPTYELLSKYNAALSRDECRKMLQSYGVMVVLQNAEGLGVLKCRLDEIRDPAGVMAVVKAVRFRIEFHLTTGVQNAAGYVTALTLVQEKGALSSFKAIHARLRHEWEMAGGTPRTPSSEIMAGDGR